MLTGLALRQLAELSARLALAELTTLVRAQLQAKKQSGGRALESSAALAQELQAGVSSQGLQALSCVCARMHELTGTEGRDAHGGAAQVSAASSGAVGAEPVVQGDAGGAVAEGGKRPGGGGDRAAFVQRGRVWLHRGVSLHGVRGGAQTSALAHVATACRRATVPEELAIDVIVAANMLTMPRLVQIAELALQSVRQRAFAGAAASDALWRR